MTTQTKPRDTAAEQRIADACGEVWRDTIFHRYGFFDTIDWWIEREGRCVAVAEVKNRDCLPDTYPTIYLALRKWLALMLASLTGPTPLFIVGFKDGSIWYVNAQTIDARRITIAGRDDRPGMPNDREPIISVPVNGMTMIVSPELTQGRTTLSA